MSLFTVNTMKYPEDIPLNETQRLFLQALRAALKNRQTAWTEPLPDAQWQELFHMAHTHHVLPLVYGAVSTCPAAAVMNPDLLAGTRRQVLQLITLQTRKTAEFLPVLEQLRQAGCTPLIVKGMICRSLYPNPDYRLSSDEDLFIPPEQVSLCRKVLEHCGLTTADPPDAGEMTYTGRDGILYLEVHRHLFPPENEAYGDLNRFFQGAWAKKISLALPGAQVWSLNHTDHLFYLICHAFKHFLHSGFGIRQVCDLCLYAAAYGGQICWEQVWAQCKKIRADRFAAALLRIGQQYLGIAGIPADCGGASPDPVPLLKDLLDGGVYGAADRSRQHSSRMTLSAASTGKGASREHHGLRHSLFPGKTELAGRYPYLKQHPVLLPVAWVQRAVLYGQKNAPGRAAESIRIGNRRIRLLQEYGIIDR